MERIWKSIWCFIKKRIVWVAAALYRKLLKKEVSEENLYVVIEFTKFCIVGTSNTILSYILNIMTLYMLRSWEVGWDYIAGNVVAFIISVLWSFYWNNKYVFRQHDKDGDVRETRKVLLRKLLRTYLSYGFTGIVLCNLLSYVWIRRLGISKMIAPLMNLVISVPLNYVINKFWAFKA